MAAAPDEALGGDLTAEQRLHIKQYILGKPGAADILWHVGAHFNDNNVLEFTCTDKTLEALRKLIPKLKWLERPMDVERYSVLKPDSRGLDTLKVADTGTNGSEASFGEIEKVFPSNGTCNNIVWQGVVLEKIGRINEAAREKRPGCSGLGHHNMHLARAHDALMRHVDRQPQHVGLPVLAPRTKSLYGIDYFTWIKSVLEDDVPAPHAAAEQPAAAAAAAASASALSASAAEVAPVVVGPAPAPASSACAGASDAAGSSFDVDDDAEMCAALDAYEGGGAAPATAPSAVS